VSGSGVRKDLGILRDRPFTLLLIARTMAMLGTAFGPVAIAFGVLGLPGATATTLSAVLTAEALPMVAFTLVGGVIADRLPRHRVIAVSETANALAYAGLAASLFTGWTPLPLLMALSAVTGISVALIHPALTGIIPDVVPPERLQTANALLGFGVNSARVAGAVLGGAAVALLGAPAALAASGATFAVAAVLVTLLGRTLPKGARDGGSSMLADLREGWHEFFSRQWLWVVVAQYSIVVLALQAANGVLGPLLARDELGGAPAWSAVLAGQAFGMVVGVLVAIRVRPRRPILVGVLLTFAGAVPSLLLGVGAPLWSVVAGAFLTGVCFDVFGVLWATTLQREVPPESLSRVASYDALGSFMLGPLGLMVAGPAAELAGVRPSLIGCAVLIILVSAAALLAPGVRRLRAPGRPVRAPAAEVPAT
jgi:predicted MFS family arabinose efflux permease